MKAKWFSSSIVAISMSLYPVAYMWRAFAEGSRVGSGPSDMNGSLFIVQSLKFMATPWATNVRSGFPDGIQFWDTISILRGAPLLASWILTRVLDPIQVLNLLVFFGWMLTGVSTFWIARLTRLSFIPAICAGILAQMLPWFANKAENHLFYVWYFLPLSAIALSLRLRSLTDHRSTGFIPIFSCLVLTFFTDTYLFVISLFCVVIVVATSVGARNQVSLIVGRLTRLPFRQKVLIWTGLAFLVAMSGALFSKILASFNRESVASGNPARGVTGNDELAKWSGSIVDFLTPSSEHWFFAGKLHLPGESDFVTYVGAAPVILVLVLLIWKFQRKLFNEINSVLFVAAGCILVALRPVEMFGTQVSLNSLLRFGLPGIRVFARFAAVGQVLVIVLAVYAAAEIAARMTSKRSAAVVFGGLIILMVVDLGPKFGAATYTNFAHYQPIQRELEASRPTGGVLIPDGKLEAIDLSMETAPDSIEWKLVNDFQGRWRPHVYLRAGMGSEEFASYLVSRGVNWVIARTDDQSRPVVRGFLQDSVRVNLLLDPYFFVPRVKQVGMDGQEVVLLEIVKSSIKQRCENCDLAQLLFSPQLDSLGASAGQLIDKTLWSQGETLQFHSELIDGAQESAKTLAKIEVRTVDPSVEISLESSDGRIIEPVEEFPGRRIFEFESLTNSQFLFRASGPCSISVPDSGPYCWGIGQFVVVALEER